MNPKSLSISLPWLFRGLVYSVALSISCGYSVTPWRWHSQIFGKTFPGSMRKSKHGHLKRAVFIWIFVENVQQSRKSDLSVRIIYSGAAALNSAGRAKAQGFYLEVRSRRDKTPTFEAMLQTRCQGKLLNILFCL